MKRNIKFTVLLFLLMPFLMIAFNNCQSHSAGSASAVNSLTPDAGPPGGPIDPATGTADPVTVTGSLSL